MGEESQRETIAFLTDLCARAGDVAPPIATHISRIYFVGASVYKLKRAVKTAYLDFSTPQKRLAACERELRLNRRTAPSLYKGLRLITRAPDGLALDGPGEMIDAVVEMSRFEQDALFDAMAQRGLLTARHIEALAARIAAFHSEADVSRNYGGANAIRDILEGNEAELRASFLGGEPELTAIFGAMRASLANHAALLDARRSAGKVRHCHGDLTLRNIALIEGEPTPFDCLEFDEALATIDVLYDLAFILMDLCHRARRDLANFLFNRYLDAADEIDGAQLLPLFIAMRAIIRAHVTARMAKDADADAREALQAEARAYLSLAGEAMRPGSALLIGVGGLSGSGKSTVAAGVAPMIPPLPGARVLSSDRIRKALFRVSPTERLPPEAYDPEVSRQVYATTREKANACLRSGWPVICDAVFDRAPDREALQNVAAGRGAAFHGFWLEAPDDMLAARISARSGDPSDATVEVLRAQRAKLTSSGGEIDWLRLDASAPCEETARRVKAALDP